MPIKSYLGKTYGEGSLLSSPHFPKREKSGLLNNLQKLVQSIIKVNSSDTLPTCIITA